MPCQIPIAHGSSDRRSVQPQCDSSSSIAAPGRPTDRALSCVQRVAGNSEAMRRVARPASGASSGEMDGHPELSPACGCCGAGRSARFRAPPIGARPVRRCRRPGRRSTALGRRRGAIDEALGQVDAAPLVEVLSQCMKDPLQRPIPAPALEAAVARLVGRISLGKVPPRGSRP